MTPQRPALAEVLAALTSEPDALWWRMMTTDHETRAVTAGIEWRIAGKWAPLRLWRREPETQRSPLRMTSPAEAVEALATARLWPWEIGDERAPRWWCERCDGTDDLTEECERFPCFSMSHPCLACDDGTNADPPTHAALVAVASLGAPMLARCIALADVIARAAGYSDARVVWRVMTRKAIVEHQRAIHEAAAPRGGAPTMCEVFALEDVVRREGGSSWRSVRDWIDATVRAAWPALRALAVGDGETPQPTGVHLVALDASRIVLAVEAL